MQRRTVLLAAAAAPLAAAAHHGWSSFDQDRPVYLEGRIKSVRWANPHAELLLARDGLAAAGETLGCFQKRWRLSEKRERSPGSCAPP